MNAPPPPPPLTMQQVVAPARQAVNLADLYRKAKAKGVLIARSEYQ